MASPLTTIYMTQEQDKQLRSEIKNRQERCKAMRGQPRESRDPKSLLAQATSAALLSDMAEATGHHDSEGDTMPALEVGQTYLPSIVGTKDLVPIRLCDLKLNTHHWGRSLAIRRIGPVVPRKTGLWTVVQDLKGSNDAERLEVVLHDRLYGERILESGDEFTIKEPFFTLSDRGEPTLRIDHPSDLVCSSFESLNGAPEGSPDQLAGMYKTEGNSALRKHDLAKTYHSYTKGLQVLSEPEHANDSLVNDIFRNRSHVNLLLGRFDEAISDALSSLTHNVDAKSKSLDGKAYFRAGSAAYRLEDWHKAQEFFTHQQALTPDDRDAESHLLKIQARLHEAAGAGYNFPKLRASLSPTCPLVDAATYPGPTEIKQTPSRGRGLFATHSIPAGELIFCEKAFCVVFSHEEPRTAWTAMTYDIRDERVRAFPAGLAQALVQKLRNNPSQVGKVLRLYSDHEGLGEDLIMGEDGHGPVIDTAQIHDIIRLNAFSPSGQGEEDVRTASAGLWIRAAYMNHSCLPNTEREFVGNLMVVRARRDIWVGEEITHIYTDARDVEVRGEALMRGWGFACGCVRCLAERADGEDLRRRRGKLEDRVDVFVKREEPVGANKAIVRRAESLVKAIEGTYDGERYEGLPRLALTNIERWLRAARGGKGKTRSAQKPS